MAGQSKWSNAGTGTNDYIVNPRLSKQIYWKSEYQTVFGNVNETRKMGVTVLEHGGNKTVVDTGNDSPVWEKDFNGGGNEARFTMVEETRGMASYGGSDVETGDFDAFMHSVVFVRKVHSKAYPIVDIESQYLVKETIDDVVKLKKDGIALWRAKEVDLDAWRAVFMGASRGLLLQTNGGMGVTLFGGSAGQQRSSYNTYVENTNDDALVTPSATLATHETSVATSLATLSDDDACFFSYESHRRYSHFIEDLDFKPTKIGGVEYRAVAFIDRRNMDRLDADSTLDGKMQNARKRGEKNPSLYHMEKFVLDDILYVPVKQLEWFRPSVAGGAITYGCGLTQDPRSKSFTNSSNICPVVFMGAGALLRGRRAGVQVTVEKGRHEVGAEYAVHYHDGWMRHDWFTKDGRSEMFNDSMLVGFHYDKGFGKSAAA